MMKVEKIKAVFDQRNCKVTLYFDDKIILKEHWAPGLGDTIIDLVDSIVQKYPDVIYTEICR